MAGVRVFPSVQDYGTVDNAGDVMDEVNLGDLFGKFHRNINAVVSGMNPSDAGGLTLEIATGHCFILGRLVEFETAQQLTMPDDSSRDVIIRATVDAAGQFDSEPSLVDVAVDTTLTDKEILLCRVTTASGSIPTNGIYDHRRGIIMPETMLYTGDGSTTARRMDIGFTPSLVMITAQGGQSSIWSCSTLRHHSRRYQLGIVTYSELSRNSWYGHQPNPDTITHEVVKWITGTRSGSGTLTLAGAAVGDGVVCTVATPAPTWVVGTDYVRGYIAVAGAVEIEMSQTLPVIVHVLQKETIYVPQRHFVHSTASDGKKTPWIVEDGFYIAGDATGTPHLNENTVDYHVLALP